MAKNRSIQVQKLADEVGLEVDEVLLQLWDLGIEAVMEPTHMISGSDLKKARRAFGLPSRRQIVSVDYWKERLGIGGDAFMELGEELDISMSPNSKTLPKGAVSKIRQYEKTVRRPQYGSEEGEDSSKEPEFDWNCIGHECEPRIPDASEVESIHTQLVSDYETQSDPIEPPGTRSLNLLESALHRASTSLGEVRKYATLEMCCAALLHSLIHNHPFHNGNKRTALVTLLVTLDLNGYVVTCDEDELFRFVLKVARHKLVPKDWSNYADRETMEIARWILQNTRQLKKGERPLAFRQARKILADFGCEFEYSKKKDKVQISRKRHTTRRLFGRKRVEILKTNIHYAGEGREIPKTTLAKIRGDLALDEVNGYDSEAFYDDSPLPASDFIERYRKTLRKLAKL